MVESDDAAVKAGRDRIERSLTNGVRRGKLDAEGEGHAREALTYAVDLTRLADRGAWSSRP